MKIEKVRALVSSTFARNFAKVLTGSFIAQTIPILFSPILSRLYSPADFGIFATYNSIISIFVVVATLKYELAIMLPKTISESKMVAYSSLFTVICLTFIYFIFAIIINFFLKEPIFKGISAFWIWMIPINVFLISVSQVLTYWIIRERKFSILSINRVGKSLSSTSTSVAIGTMKISSNGLLWGNLLSNLFSGINLIYSSRRIFTTISILEISIKDIKSVLKKHKYFAFYTMPSELLNTFAAQIPIILLSMFYSDKEAGSYSFVFAVLGVPLTIVSSAITDVFKEKANDDYRTKGNSQQIFKAVFLGLFSFGLIPFTILFLFSSTIFFYVFGSQWNQAGEFATIFSFMFLLKLVCSPLSYMYNIANKQKEDFFLHIYIGISSLLIFIVAIYFDFNSKTALIIYAINQSLIYLVYLYRSYIFSKG